jgi:hypothetical protein
MRWSLAVAFLTTYLFFPSGLQAEVWRCPQENGTDLFTNQPSDSSKCEKYVSNTEVIPEQSSSTTPSAPPPTADNAQESPIIEMPYARDGPTVPEYPPPSYPQYQYYDPYSYGYYYPYYGGLFGFRSRPFFRFGPSFRPHGVPRHPHSGTSGHRHSGMSGRSSHHR